MRFVAGEAARDGGGEQEDVPVAEAIWIGPSHLMKIGRLSLSKNSGEGAAVTQAP